jgi:AcrR family transcriptional regulator
VTPVSDAGLKDVLAADGRVIGSRAQATRSKLLEATAQLLEEHGPLELKVVDITRAVGSSPATFYQYFQDVDAAILALVEESLTDLQPLVATLMPAWDITDGLERARAFLTEYMRYWNKHNAVLKYRNLRAEEDAKSFRQARSHANMMVIEPMAAMVSEGIRSGRLSPALEPFTTSAAIIAMIERLLAFQPSMRQRGATTETMLETLAVIMYQTLTGRDA